MNSDRNRNFTEFGMRLYKLMKERGESYKDVYQLLRPDMKNFEPDDLKDSDNNALRRIRSRMTGKVKTSLAELITLADHYKVSIDYLVGRDDTETGLSAEAIHSLKSVSPHLKEYLNPILENTKLLTTLAETAHCLKHGTDIHKSYYNMDDEDIRDWIYNEMDWAKLSADSEIFRAVTELANALRDLYPNEKEYMYLSRSVIPDPIDFD